MVIYSYYLEKAPAKEEIELRLGIRFEKVLEKAYYVKITDEKYIFLTAFNCITFIGFDKDGITTILRPVKNEIAFGHINQDYIVEIDGSIQHNFKITNSKILLSSFSEPLLFVVALIVSQSVALEKYETILDRKLSTSKGMLTSGLKGYFSKRKPLVALANSLAVLRHEMVVELYLLDKPNILWDDESAEKLYNELSLFFELKERFAVVEYKLNLLKEDIAFLTDILNHKKSEFLEWIIIALIAFEIIMSFFKMAG